MSKVYITGTSGHVGGIILDYLKDYFDVITINRSSKLSNSILNFDSSGFENYLDDKEFDSSDVFIHVASSIDFNNLNPDLSYYNAYFTHKLFVLLKQKNLKKIILISSAPLSGYSDHPITEEKNVELSNIYYLTKYYQENLLKFISFDKFYSFRISSPISPYLNRNSIFKVFMDTAINNDEIKILGNGLRKQNYIDVRDIAIQIRNTISSEFESGVYNICSEYSISNIDLSELIISTIESKSPISHHGFDPADHQNWVFDISKAKKLLNFNPKFSLVQTIKDYLVVNK
jgi:nucleoside-diphosphate-sugar epimerase